MAQTMRIIQKQMRASRAKIAEHISGRMALGVNDYPLASALSDVEDYYRAGTLTTGIIDASTNIGEEEKDATERMQEVSRMRATARPEAIRRLDAD